MFASSFTYRRIRPLGVALIALAAAMSMGANGAAQAGRSILQYDKDGRATGVIVEEGSESADPDGNAVTPDETQGDHESREILAIDPPNSILPRLQSMGFSVLERLRLQDLKLNVWRIGTPENLSTEEGLRRFQRAFPDVESDLNTIFTLSAAPHGKNPPLPYDRKTVGWGAVSASCGNGMRIGIIDSPVHVNHEVFKGQQVVHKSFISGKGSAAPEEHGTAIAAMLVGGASEDTAGGLVPGAQLYAASIFENRGGRVVGNLSAMLRAVNWLASQRIHVLNLSIAGSRNKVLVMAIDKAVSEGMVLVAAAGNNGPDAKPAWPAAHPRVIAVTAVDKNLSQYRFANQGGYIDFAAPGVRILTATPRGFKEQSGTSFAAPYITSMVAVHLAAGYQSDPDILRDSLKRYSVDLGTKGKDQVFGWGLVRLRPDC